MKALGLSDELTKALTEVIGAVVEARARGEDAKERAAAAAAAAMKAMKGQPKDLIDHVYFEALRLENTNYMWEKLQRQRSRNRNSQYDGGRRRLTRRKRKGTRRH